MEPKDSAQYSVPGNTPKGKSPDPQLPGDEREKDVIKGAKNEDQLDKLKPTGGADKAQNEVGSPPNTEVNKGDSSDS